MYLAARRHFNPRSPCGERQMIEINNECNYGFQSTLPMRGATAKGVGLGASKVFQSTLPMRGATLTGGLNRVPPGHFNPRSPCGERPAVSTLSSLPALFQSTLPMRGATAFKMSLQIIGGISIHAPHAGSDENLYNLLQTVRDFNPRSPCGERRCKNL